jgi:AcrR family transcriptional regulator
MDEVPRSAKGKRTRSRLVEAAKVVFERDGFLQARIADISAEAGVSHGSFYHYFLTKEAIFRVVAQGVQVHLLSMDDELHSAPGMTAVDRIRASNRGFLTAYEREARIMRVIEEVSRYDDDVRLVRGQRDADLTKGMEAAIGRLQEEGIADRRIDGRYAAVALMGMVASFAEQMFATGDSYDLTESVEQLTVLWANALGLPGEPRRREGEGRPDG